MKRSEPTTAAPRPAAGRGAAAVWVSLPAAAAVAAGTVTIEATGRGGGDGVLAIGLLLLVGVGCLVAARRPRNPVGWLLLLYGFNFELSVFGETLATAVYLDGRDLPGASVAAWYVAWGWAVGLALLALAFLHFPDGRLPSGGWRPVRWAAVASIALFGVAGALLWPGRGPAYLEMSTGLPGTVPWWLDDAGLVVLNLVMPLALLSLLARYRRADLEQRRQLKWVVPAIVMVIVGLGILAVAGRGPTLAGGWTTVGEVVSVLGLAGLVVSMALAILKYRLYDIDRIVSRTVAYLLVTVVLAGAYVGAVVTLRVALAPITGETDLAVAGSTLAVAALFGPLRRRVQTLVDRRFNRARYDASRAVDAFGQRLRDQVDLRAVADDLTTTAGSTLQPATVSVWLSSETTP